MTFEIKWDKWQSQVLAWDGSLTIRAGRQVGKSEVISEKSVNFASDNTGVVVMIIAASQRQGSLLFEKVVAKLSERKLLSEKPTLTKAVLLNGSRIYCMPAGRTGHFIRGFTIDMLIADEAAFIPEMVWLAITPMLAVSKKLRGMGHIVLLSTPFGKGGYYYDSFTDKDFRSWHVSAEDCIRMDKGFLRKEKLRMTKAQYAQEYLGEFAEEFNQYFKTALIKRCMTFIEWNRKDDGVLGASYYLGIDLARLGGDEIASVVVELHDKRLKAVKCFVRVKREIRYTVGETVVLDGLWGFKRFFLDSGGMGGAAQEQFEDALGKRRVVGLDNSSKGIQVEGKEKRVKILKEDLYSNLLVLMENGQIELISDLSLLRSLKCITFKHTADKRVELFGNYSHLTEALVRACWCLKDRGLNLYIY